MARQQTVIENPILNSPFEEPTRHFRFDDDGITSDVVASRRTSSYFVPIAQTRSKGKQLVLDSDWTEDRLEENKLINDIGAVSNCGDKATTRASRVPHSGCWPTGPILTETSRCSFARLKRSKR